MGLGGPKWMDFGDILAIHVDLKAILTPRDLRLE
jgi:hypothetical protein